MVLFIFFLVRNSKKSSKGDEKEKNKQDKEMTSREQELSKQKSIESFSNIQDKSISERIENYRKENE